MWDAGEANRGRKLKLLGGYEGRKQETSARDL